MILRRRLFGVDGRRTGGVPQAQEQVQRPADRLAAPLEIEAVRPRAVEEPSVDLGGPDQGLDLRAPVAPLQVGRERLRRVDARPDRRPVADQASQDAGAIARLDFLAEGRRVDVAPLGQRLQGRAGAVGGGGLWNVRRHVVSTAKTAVSAAGHGLIWASAQQPGRGPPPWRKGPP